MSSKESQLVGYKAIVMNTSKKRFAIRITPPSGVKISKSEKKGMYFDATEDKSARGDCTFNNMCTIPREIFIKPINGDKYLSLKVRGPIVIPGRKIDENTRQIKITPKLKKPIKLNKKHASMLDTYSRTQTLLPFSSPRYLTKENHLSIDLLFLIEQKSGEKVLRPEEINFYFDLGFDSGGGNLMMGDRVYKLFLYAEYDTKQKVESHSGRDENMYHIYEYRIVFSKKSLKTFRDEIVRLIEVSKVQAVVITQNPETSRGTETTVQQGGS